MVNLLKKDPIYIISKFKINKLSRFYRFWGLIFGLFLGIIITKTLIFYNFDIRFLLVFLFPFILYFTLYGDRHITKMYNIKEEKEETEISHKNIGNI
jgi:uncharacterized protein YacL